MPFDITNSNDLLEHDLLLLKKKVVNAPQIFKQQLSLGSQVVDLEYNDLVKNFTIIHLEIKSLFEACKRYKISQNAFFYSSINVLEIFHKLLDGTNLEWASPRVNKGNAIQTSEILQGVSPRKKTYEFLQDFYNSTGIENLSQKKVDINKLNQHIQVIAQKVEQDLEFFEKNVTKPISEIDDLMSRIVRHIDARAIKNLEVSSLNDKYASFKKISKNNTKILTSKQEVDRMKCERNLKRVYEDFEVINVQLKNQLPLLFELINNFLQEWFPIYYYTTLRISYALHNYSSNSPEFKKIIGTDVTNSDHIQQISNTDIFNQFHGMHDFALREIENLKILNYYNHYQDVINKCEEKDRLKYK